MAHENTHEQKPSRFALWQRKRTAKKTYNLALKDLKTTKKLLDKYKPERTPKEKNNAAKELAQYQKDYASALLNGSSTHTVHRNDIYRFIAKHLASIKLNPEVKKFLASISKNISSQIELCVGYQVFWDNFLPLSDKNRAKTFEEIFSLGTDHIDYGHIVKLFQESLGAKSLHTLLNNRYLPANTKQQLLKLIFTSENRDAEAFGKILFSEKSQLSASEIRAALPDEADGLPKALVAAFEDSLDSSTLKLSDKFFVLDIISSYNIGNALKNTAVLKQEIEQLYQIFFPQEQNPAPTEIEGATFFPLIALELNPEKIIQGRGRDEYISALCQRLGITEAETAEKEPDQKLEIITARVAQLTLLLKQKIAELDIYKGEYELVYEQDFKDKATQLRNIAFRGTGAIEENNLASLQRGNIHLYQYLTVSGLVSGNNLELIRAKREAFDHALTSEVHRTALAELALLPNDPYGARQYLEEKSHPGFWSRVSRKLFWWTEHNKKEIELTNLAKNTFDTLTPKVELPLLVRQEIPVAPEKPISAPTQRSSSASKIVAATMGDGSPELLRTSTESSPRSFDSEELEGELDKVVETTPVKLKLSSAQKAKLRTEDIEQKVAGESKIQTQGAKHGLVI